MCTGEREQKCDSIINTHLSGKGPWRACIVQSSQIEFKSLGKARNSIAQEPPGGIPHTSIGIKKFCDPFYILTSRGISRAYIFISNKKKKKKDTEGTRAIKNLQKQMYAPQLYYGHKNICDKDGGICTHWPLKVINKTKTKRQKKKSKTRWAALNLLCCWTQSVLHVYAM